MFLTCITVVLLLVFYNNLEHQIFIDMQKSLTKTHVERGCKYKTIWVPIYSIKKLLDESFGEFFGDFGGKNI